MNKEYPKTNASDFGRRLSKCLVMLGLIAVIIGLITYERTQSHPRPPKWPLASRECLSGMPLTDAQLIALALKDEQEFLAPYKIRRPYIIWHNKPDSDWWKGENFESYAQRDQHGTDLGLKRWAVVIIEYGSGSNYISSWYDACGNRFG